MEKKIYQIEIVNAVNQDIIDNKIPNGLFSFEVFRSKEEADKWMEIYGYGEGITEYKVVEYDTDDIEEYSFVSMPEETDTLTEVCPHCGEEVELHFEFKLQSCPNCHKMIAPCCLCNHDVCECHKCKLNH